MAPCFSKTATGEPSRRDAPEACASGTRLQAAQQQHAAHHQAGEGGAPAVVSPAAAREGAKPRRVVALVDEEAVEVRVGQQALVARVQNDALLVLLGLFITVDVLGRYLGGVYSGATDEISVFVMALAATWALSYTSMIGKHIRIDLTLHWLSPRLRRIADYGGVALLCAFAVAEIVFGPESQATTDRFGVGWMVMVRGDG